MPQGEYEYTPDPEAHKPNPNIQKVLIGAGKVILDPFYIRDSHGTVVEVDYKYLADYRDVFKDN